jgi:hypothetical protein
MLFDLQGKRRRVVQATYLTLAVLMGGGLILFGIGGDVSGGLVDAFNGGGGGSGNEVAEERIESNEERVASNPQAQRAREELVRDYYSLAVSQTDPNTGAFPTDAQDELQAASRNWNAYLELEGVEPDPSLANVALQIFDPRALNQPEQAVRAARVIAQDGDDVGSYLLLVQYAAFAGDKRTLALASKKAVALAPERQRKQVRRRISQIEGQAIAQQLQESGDLQLDGAGGGQGGAGGGQSGGQGNTNKGAGQ